MDPLRTLNWLFLGMIRKASIYIYLFMLNACKLPDHGYEDGSGEIVDVKHISPIPIILFVLLAIWSVRSANNKNKRG